MPAGTVIETLWVMVIGAGPYPPGVSTITSPPTFVTEIAPPKVLQGAEAPQLVAVLASLPVVDTNVRPDAAQAEPAITSVATATSHATVRLLETEDAPI
jgi:hypothetical protein